MKYVCVMIAVLMMTACGKSAEEQAKEDYAKAFSGRMDKHFKKMDEAQEDMRKDIEMRKAQRATQNNKRD